MESVNHHQGPEDPARGDQARAGPNGGQRGGRRAEAVEDLLADQGRVLADEPLGIADDRVDQARHVSQLSPRRVSRHDSAPRWTRSAAVKPARAAGSRAADERGFPRPPDRRHRPRSAAICIADRLAQLLGAR